MTVGGVGVVSVASHLDGVRLQEMIRCFNTGEVARAVQMNLQLFPLFKNLFCMTNPIPVKAALQLVGWPVGGVRPPLCDLLPECQEKVTKTLQDLNIIN
jgi:4-hydroxy-tetrahydrodipicolinate synthase